MRYIAYNLFEVQNTRWRIKIKKTLLKGGYYDKRDLLFLFLFQFHLENFYNCSFVCKSILSYIGIRYQKKDNVPQSKTSMMYIFEFYYLLIIRTYDEARL